MKLMLDIFPEFPSKTKVINFDQHVRNDYIKDNSSQFIALANKLWERVNNHYKDEKDAQLRRFFRKIQRTFRAKFVELSLSVPFRM